MRNKGERNKKKKKIEKKIKKMRKETRRRLESQRKKAKNMIHLANQQKLKIFHLHSQKEINPQTRNSIKKQKSYHLKIRLKKRIIKSLRAREMTKIKS